MMIKYSKILRLSEIVKRVPILWFPQSNDMHY